MPLTPITSRSSTAYNQASSVRASVQKMAQTVLSQDGKKADHAKVDDHVELRGFKPTKQKILDTLTGKGKSTNSLTGWAERSDGDLKRLSLTKKTSAGEETYGFKLLGNGTKEYTAPSGDGRSIKVLETSTGTLFMGDAEPSDTEAGNATLFGTHKLENDQLVPVSKSKVQTSTKAQTKAADQAPSASPVLSNTSDHALHGELRWVDGKLVQS